MKLLKIGQEVTMIIFFYKRMDDKNGEGRCGKLKEISLFLDRISFSLNNFQVVSIITVNKMSIIYFL